MVEKTTSTQEHTLALRPGDSADLTFHFAQGGITIKLATADPTARRIELALEEPWGAYELKHLAQGPDGRRWTPLRAGPDGWVHTALDLAAGERVYVLSEDDRTHSLRLEKSDWQGDTVILTFREMA